jgi:hypothetical protein
MVDGEPHKFHEHTSTVVSSKTNKSHTCLAYLTDKYDKVWSEKDKSKLTEDEIKKQDFGHCGKCRSCWDKRVSNVAYLEH